MGGSATTKMGPPVQGDACWGAGTGRGAPAWCACRLGGQVRGWDAPHSHAPVRTLLLRPPTLPCTPGLSPAQLAKGTSCCCSRQPPRGPRAPKALLPGSAICKNSLRPEQRPDAWGTAHAVMASCCP